MKLNANIVFVAEHIDSHSNATIHSTDLEMLNDTYYQQVNNALQDICDQLTYYSSPKRLIENAKLHKSDVVLSLWSGEKSRNRRALIPSICEAYGIAYVGADSYVHTISQDKYLSKLICREHGILCPNGVLIDSNHDYNLINSLKFPVVIKPNCEGGSIGIFAENLANNYQEAIQVCSNLLPQFTPLIVEEYVPGEEVSVCIAGTHEKNLIFQVVRQYIGDKTFLDHEIFSAEIKKIDNSNRHRDLITKRFPNSEKDKLIELYQSLGKVEVIRFDGRLNNEGFHMIEFTPDCSLSLSSSVSLSFREEGYSYKDMFQFLCNNALTSPQLGYQSAKE